ncbi:Pet127-domain-containing protein [Amniculicola lignicola CBS 123094]|uniref:Pet127-domain-containing protein n=1 Tax=Amniculicola lignicola CBS 123094 TaxID=1392246 RepID=A0A6A5X1W7_9PLEO|nr:Pet127-domain-containing protein [Amniculicola lignicola CBS 123094]
MLGYGLDRVLFNAGVYRLQDPRSRVYNFDPYLEEIMPVQEFDFDALTAYKTSSQDESLLAITKEHGTKFTGSTSSMSGVLSQFHHLISGQRLLNHKMLSQTFVAPSNKFSKVSRAPTSIFLRRKNGVHAIDADKSFDSPNVMSWLGHSMEKLLTTTPEEFEKFRRSNAAEAPKEDGSARCFHYSKQGNFLIRSQLDAYDPRLPGAGIFDVKTRAVVSIRMNAEEYETGLGYQLRYDHGEWESYEREFYDMSRATMLKYSLQVRMGRMDGIFVAYHNIERMFGFQYLSLADMDRVLHGQTDPCLGDQEFKMSVHLFDEVLQRATERFPDNEIRLTFHVSGKTPSYMAIIAEPFTSEEVDNIQASKKDIFDEFKWKVVGGQPDESKMQSEWRDIQERVNEELISEEATEQGEDEEAITNDVNASNVEEQPKGEEPSATGAQMTEAPAQAEKPIMGWTLTVRNRVNGNTTDRPENLEPSDDWALEYFLQEIPEEGRGKVHANLQKSIMSIFGQDQAARDVDLRFYRQKIQKWTDAGRRWQEEQKEIDEKMGKQIYRPLGPGSEAASTPVSSQDK